MAMDAANRLSAIAAEMGQLQNQIQEHSRVLNLFLRSVRTLDPTLKEVGIRSAREHIEDLFGGDALSVAGGAPSTHSPGCHPWAPGIIEYSVDSFFKKV
ncbi:hypothetical protein GQ457_05G020520 [Hibiscus cannabinus]